MIENHNICDFTVFHEDFKPFNYLGHRDKQVVRQCIQNFSVVVGLVRASSIVPRVLEMGAGLSTVIFSTILDKLGEKIKTIDAFAYDAIQLNSRGTSDCFNLSDFKNCDIVKGITISHEELDEFYRSPYSTLLSLSHEEVVCHLDLFINLSMDDRKYQKINQILNCNYLTSSLVKKFFLQKGLFLNDLLTAYRTESDEFDFLKKSHDSPVLKSILESYSPNIIYLDSGEFSSNLEFNHIDEISKKGTLLIVQDIFFPKSIKSFLIASTLMISERWRVLWVDRTTPQGMMICKKEV